MPYRTFLAFLLIATLVCVSSASAQSVEETFAEQLKVDDRFLEYHPLIREAHEKWKERIEQTTTSYVEKLEKTLDREKPKGDLKFLKGLEKTLETSKTHHKGCCIVFERLPTRIQSLQTEMNKAKSRANRTFLEVLDREIAAALRQKDLEKAKAVEGFLFASFLPEILGAKFGEAVRHENKIYLYNESKLPWTEARDWCRERNGDLASIGDKETNDRLIKIMRKQTQGDVRQSWSGGVRVDGRWFWTDGTLFRYTNWIKGQPSGVSHKGIRQDYISFAVHKEAGWDDNSNFPLPFMIQWTIY